jgi:acyl-CoA synthetase (NDP forming)
VEQTVRPFFYPEGVAVFGVSEASANLARVIVENLERFEFKGRVFPVGPRKGVVAGKGIITDADAIEGAADLAVLLVPAPRIPETLEACARNGIRHVIIESGGFSELNIERKDLENEIRSIASRWEMRIVGPNCFGASNFEKGLVLPFFVLDPSYMRRGNISVISQSGGIVYDTCMLASCEKLGLNKLISMGNKLLLNENDFLDYLVTDPGTGVIGLYLEDFSNGRRFVEIAASTDKPIILLKTNRSPLGNEIARFHTTALAGDDLIAGAALKEAGVHRVQSLAEMIDAYKAFSMPPLKGRRLALITRSGGHGVLSADGAERYGFELAGFSEDFYESVREKKINVIRATNPLDVGDIYDIDAYTTILEKALQEKTVDGVAFIVTFSSESDGMKVERFVENAANLSRSHGKPAALCAVSNGEQWSAIRRAADFPLFTDIDHALRALAQSVDHVQSRGARRAFADRLKGAKDGQSSRPSGPPRFMDPDEVFPLLRRYGIPIPPLRGCR